MSQISTIYDSLRSTMSTILPSHKELVNTRNIESNDLLFMTQGQGLLLAEGFNTQRMLSCKLSVSRNVVATITRQVFGTDRDISKRVATEKSLLEDHFLIVREFDKNVTVSGVVGKISYISDNGIQEIYLDQLLYLMIQTTFNFEYLEDLT